jgi:hypothetical protein
MPILAKLVFSAVVIAIGLSLLALKADANNAGPDWLWRGGKRDSVRALFLKPDGSIRRTARAAALTIFALAVVLLWVIVPTTG